jgi:hypothetical protein
MKTTVRLNVKTAYIIIFVYIVLEILLNILLRIFLESGASEETSRLIDSVIGIGMVTNIIISILLIFTTIYIFRADTRDIYLENSKFSLSKFYYLFPLVWFGIALYALLTSNLSFYTLSTILLVIMASLSIAINEEILTRGILIIALRKRGTAEWVVYILSTLTFALLHLVNVLGGGSITQVLIVIFGGTLLYISRRVFNNLFVPILLHAFYDTAIYLQTGIFFVNQNLPDGILDFNLASFLIMVLATFIFLIFGRNLLKKYLPISEALTNNRRAHQPDCR